VSSLNTTQRPAPAIVFPQPDIPMLTNPQPVRETFSVISWVYTPTQDPFSLSFAEYSRLSYREALELQNEVCKAKSNLLNDAWRRGKRQIVICDGKIVYETESLEDIPNDKIMELAKTYDKACFVFSAPDIVEESAWILVDEEDYYPTIPLYLGTEDLDESHITQTRQIAADFDTGNPIYKIFDANQLPEPLSSFTPPVRTGTHLGRNYMYFQKHAKICVKDMSGKVHSILRDVRLVKDWKGCAMMCGSGYAFPNRTGYVGRDLLRDLEIKIELDPITRISRIDGISS